MTRILAALGLVALLPFFACVITTSDGDDGKGGGGGTSNPSTGGNTANGGNTASGGGGGSAVTTTPGTMVCGSNQCSTATETCCYYSGNISASTCSVLNPGEYCDTTPATSGWMASMVCDDAADCDAGKRCCGTWSSMDYLVTYCSDEPCGDYEVCIPGGDCDTGMHCESDVDLPTGAVCQTTNPKTSHCNGTECTGSTPVCAWNSTTGVGSCQAEDYGCQIPESCYICTTKSDCPADYQCCALVYGSTCTGDCHYLTGSVLCNTLSDCPDFYGVPATSCAEDTSSPDYYPDGVKLCGYN